MKTTEEWDEEYERNIHVDLPGRRRVGEPYREHIRQLETQRDQLMEALEELVFLIDHDAIYDDVPEPTEMIRARAAIEEGGQDE